MHAEMRLFLLQTEVLILIVLDHLIMPLRNLAIRPIQRGLNPYCIGSSNHALHLLLLELLVALS